MRRTLRQLLRVENLEDRALLAASPFVPNEVIVKFKEGFAPVERASVLSAVSADKSIKLEDDSFKGAKASRIELLQGTDDVMASIAALKRNPMVEYAEPNWIYNTSAVPNDPLYTNGSLWGMYGDASTPANQFGSQAAEAWNAGFTGSDTVYVGIIDEGIDFNHPDLSANVWTNPFDTFGDGIDNDGNGYIDDTHGWDFDGNNNSVYDGTGDDHGTHVAGTIAAKGGDGIGVAGVNWNVKYISAKFLGATGGTTANAIRAVDYITNLKTRHGLNIVATNNSWGGGGFSQGLLDAINRAGAANILFVAAAGNSAVNTDTTAHYPGSYNSPNVLTVASITSTGALSSFSNFGATTVDIGAPGSAIVSTLPGNTYGSYSGTSMATPHVTGAAALYASVNPGATAAQIKSAILASATPTSSLAGRTLTGGRLNIGTLMGTDGPITPTLSISDRTANEGNSGTTSFSFTVSLNIPSSTAITVDYATSLGTAGAGDLVEVPTTLLTFAPGETSKTVTIDVVGDTAVEANETFLVNLSNASGAGIADGQGLGTITNDDAPPVPGITINDVSAVEGNSGTRTFVFTVSLSSASASAVTVRYATANGTATSNGTNRDYNSTSGTLTIPAGATSRTISVTVRGDRRSEQNETFFVNLSNPVGATLSDNQGLGTILNDDGTTGAGDSGDEDEVAVDAFFGTFDLDGFGFTKKR